MHLSSEREDEAARATLGGGAKTRPACAAPCSSGPRAPPSSRSPKRWAGPRHTVRGAMAGALKKELGLTITPEKIDGRRVYRIVE